MALSDCGYIEQYEGPVLTFSSSTVSYSSLDFANQLYCFERGITVAFAAILAGLPVTAGLLGVLANIVVGVGLPE